MLNALKNLIETSNYGVYIDAGIYEQFLDNSTKYLSFDRKVTEEDTTISIKLLVKNTTDRSIRLKSIILADFKLNVSPDKILENGWLCSSLSNIVSNKHSTQKNNVVLKRDSNPFSFEEAFGSVKNSIVSEWFTKLVFENNTLLIGATTTDKFYTQIYVSEEEHGGDCRIRITCQTDDIDISPDNTIETEIVKVFQGSEKDTEDKFSQAIKEDMKVKVEQKPLTGLIMSYYYSCNFISQKLFDSQIEKLKELGLKDLINCICIDAGYCKYWGDWLDSSERFKDGMRYAADKIKSLGYTPGIWVAPLVADPRSKMYENNKKWFFRDTGLNMNVRFTSPIEKIMPNMGLKIADPTNESYLDYITDVANTFSNIGFEMFKLDFLYPLAFFHDFSIKISRVKALRNILSIFKYAENKNHILMSGLSQLSPLIGLADLVRVGSDSGSPYVRVFPIAGNITNEKVLKRSLETSEYRMFLNRKAWLNDYDCVVFNSANPNKSNLLNKQIEMVFGSGASLWLGDDLTKLNTEQVKYIKEIFSIHKKTFNTFTLLENKKLPALTTKQNT